jgi:hypothetical protein
MLRLGIFSLLLLSVAPLQSQAQQSRATNVVYFDLNAPSLNDIARHTIDDLMAQRKLNKDQKLLLYGYADYLGSRAHNDSLSTDRAMNVRAYLLSKGFPESNISICVGKGAVERTPAANHAGYARDRKVEIITDTARMRSLICRPMAVFEPLGWQKNVSKLNVHAADASPKGELSDNAVILRLPNGDKYIGELNKKGDKINGGTYCWQNGDFYMGEYKADKRNGKGIYTWANGDVLDGVWKDDEIVSGTLIIPYDGVLYHSDEAHTHSSDVFKGNLQFQGTFRNHKFNGHGDAGWPNGDRYSGDWVDDKMNGQGTYTWITGLKYKGEWKDNKMNGKGALLSVSGMVMQEGTWVMDEFTGPIPPR